MSIASAQNTFVIVTLSSEGPERVGNVQQRIRSAREHGLMVLLLVGDISPLTMHQIMREGVAEFAPYPEPAGALVDAIDRLRLTRANGNLPAVTSTNAPRRLGKVVAFYGVAGGVGASTFAVNCVGAGAADPARRAAGGAARFQLPVRLHRHFPIPIYFPRFGFKPSSSGRNRFSANVMSS